jgi:hypothetical protein
MDTMVMLEIVTCSSPFAQGDIIQTARGRDVPLVDVASIKTGNWE